MPAPKKPAGKLTDDDTDQYRSGSGPGLPPEEMDQEWPMDSAWWGTLKRPEYEGGPLFGGDG